MKLVKSCHGECQDYWFVMVIGVSSIVPDSSCHLFSELECRPRDPCVNETNTWHFSIKDIDKSKRFKTEE